MESRPRVVIESPLSGDFAKNRRYAVWCCRHAFELGYAPIASHLLAPWYMDDRIPAERAAGIAMPWCWMIDAPHLFYIDLGLSSGMTYAMERCRQIGITIHENQRLPEAHWKSFEAGTPPPHTPGFV